MGRNYFIGLCFCLYLGGACHPEVVHRWEKEVEDTRSWYEVSEILSGSTIKLADGRTIGYLGIQSPQKDEYLFEKARTANALLLRAKKVILQLNTVSPNAAGPELAYVFAPTPIGIFCFVNKELLQYGYAKTAEYPQSHRYKQDFIQLENEARQANLGIWSQHAATKP